VLHVTATPEVVDGELVKMIIGMTDVTQQRSTMAWLAHEATHDQLTGLYNRNQFLAFLTHALDRQTRSPERLAAVLFMDVDGLKATNDAYGHNAGDRLLRAVSSRILAAVRPADVVARYGGDEFVVLCDDLADADEAMVIGQRISEAARSAGVGDHACSLSIGVAMAAPSMDPIDVVQAADHAMYVMKRAGHRRGFRHGLTVVPDRNGTATDAVSARTWVVPPIEEVRRRLSVIARSASLLRKSRDHMNSEAVDDTIVAIENQAHVLVEMMSDVLDLDAVAADTDRRPPITR
jgi:diguanylate cyclase (GGDEF)-like protein